MKRLFFTLIIGLMALLLKANPTPGSVFQINELLFDSTGNWTIELLYNKVYGNQNDTLFQISSSTEKAKIKSMKFGFEGHGLIVINNDSLNKNLFINPEGDSLFIGGAGLYVYFIFGNYLNSIVRKPSTGQSIAQVFSFYDDVYCIDKTPSIGFDNDTSGIMGTIYGRVYDRNNKPVNSGCFELNLGFNLYPEYDDSLAKVVLVNSDGTYSKRVFTLKYEFGSVYNLLHNFDNLRINPITFTMAPDSAVILDIHLIDSLYAGVERIKHNSDVIFKIWPNPINSTMAFDYEIDIPVKSTNCIIDLVSIEGRVLERFRISDNKGKIQVPTGIKNGTYMLRLLLNSKIYNSTIILINR